MSAGDLFAEQPPDRQALARGQPEAAIQILEEKGRLQGLSPGEELRLALLHALRGGMEAASSLLMRLGDSPERSIAAEALLRLANLRLSGSGPPAEIGALLDRAAVLMGEDGSLRGLLAHVRSRVHWKKSEVTAAESLLQEARALLEAAGDDEELSKVLDSLAMVHDHRGDRERALSCYALSLSKKALVHDLPGIAITLGNLGRFHLRNGQPSAALSCLRDDLQIATRMGDGPAEAVVRINIGQALTELSRPEEALAELEAALALARRLRLRPQESYALKDLARAAAARGDRGQARALLDQALEIAAGLPGYVRGQVLLARGELFLGEKDLDPARSDFHEARRCFAAIEARQEEAAAIHGLARVSEERHDVNSCLAFLEKGLERLETISVPLVDRFEETYSRLHLASSRRLVPERIGPYRVLDWIGGGTFADVYKAFDSREESSRETVALKVLKVAGQSDVGERMARFRREREILTAIVHPNVVRLIGSGEDPVPYLVQEFVPGGDLTTLLEPTRRPSAAEAEEVIRGILQGLQALHEKEVVHRDLKPANVLLRTDRQPVIADFGISRMVDVVTLTLQSMVLGTLAYMAPEQLRGEPVDSRADLYALGAIAFELLSGRLPYPGRTLREILASVESGPPPRLEALRSDLAPALLRLVRRCLARERDARYASAEEALRDLGSRG